MLFSMRLSRRSAAFFGIAALASASACSAFVSLDGLQSTGTPDGTVDGATDGATTNDGGGNPCGAPLDTDPKNCGACGHVCGTDNTISAPTCAAGKCVLQCKAGYDNCDADGSKGCETALTSDNARACGSCGRDCLEGTCTNYQCSTVTVFSVPAGQNLHDVAVDGTHVYWTQDYADENPTDAGACTAPEGGIYRSEPDGGDRALLASNEHPLEVGVDDAGVYFKSNDKCGSTVAGSFRRIGKDGKCSTGACPSTLGNVTFLTDDLGVRAGNVYFFDSTNNLLYAVRTAGAPPLPPSIADSFHAYQEQLAPDSVGVVWTTENNQGSGKPAILGLSVDSSSGVVTEGAKTLVVPESKPLAIASDGATVYYGTADAIYSVPRNGGAATKVSGAESPYAIAVDDDAIYWTSPTTTNSVLRIGKDGTCRNGSCPEVLATGGQPHQIAVDAVAVYWLDGNSKILKVGK